MSQNLKKVHWTKDALCKFDKKFTSYHIDEVTEAKSVCEQCTVQVECIMANMDVNGSFISAGLSKFDRLILQWKRVEDESESSFRDDSVYVSVVMRRVR
jgi:hypothetical protein